MFFMFFFLLMCTFGLSGCRVKPRRPHQTGPPGLAHDNQRTPNAHIWASRRFKHHQNSTNKTKREGEKNENCGGRGEKKARNFGPPPFGAPQLRAPQLRAPTLRGSTLRGLHFFWVWPPILWGPTMTPKILAQKLDWPKNWLGQNWPDPNWSNQDGQNGIGQSLFRERLVYLAVFYLCGRFWSDVLSHQKFCRTYVRVLMAFFPLVDKATSCQWLLTSGSLLVWIIISATMKQNMLKTWTNATLVHTTTGLKRETPQKVLEIFLRASHKQHATPSTNTSTILSPKCFAHMQTPSVVEYSICEMEWTTIQIVDSRSTQVRMIHGCDTQLLYVANGPTVSEDGSCRANDTCALQNYVQMRLRSTLSEHANKLGILLHSNRAHVIVAWQQSSDHTIPRQQSNLRLTHFQCSQHAHACNLGGHHRTHFQKECNFTDFHPFFSVDPFDYHTTSTFAVAPPSTSWSFRVCQKLVLQCWPIGRLSDCVLHGHVLRTRQCHRFGDLLFPTWVQSPFNLSNLSSVLRSQQNSTFARCVTVTTPLYGKHSLRVWTMVSAGPNLSLIFFPIPSLFFFSCSMDSFILPRMNVTNLYFSSNVLFSTHFHDCVISTHACILCGFSVSRFILVFLCLCLQGEPSRSSPPVDFLEGNLSRYSIFLHKRIPWLATYSLHFSFSKRKPICFHIFLAT